MLQPLGGENAELGGDGGEDQNRRVNRGEGDVELFHTRGPEFGGGAAESEVDGEETREEHDFAAKPHDGSHSNGVRTINGRRKARRY